MLALLALASFEAVTPLAAAARELSATLASGRRLLELTTREAAVRDPATPAPPPAWPFTVALDDVRARYPDQPDPALDGVSLRLAPGERVALVGPSGAGKTTVTNLLLRFLDPEAGRVTLAQRDLRDYAPRGCPPRDLGRRPGVASLLGEHPRQRPPAPPGRRATRRSSTRSAAPGSGTGSAALPDGLDTFVGEEGRALSGGQRQRLVLARALLADAPVLVLDEPTAHLDPGTASELMRDVFAAAAGRTVLLITHRDEGLDLVDRVVTLRGVELEPDHPNGMRRSRAPRQRVRRRRNRRAVGRALTIRVVCGEDSYIAREGILRALEDEEDIEVVATCRDFDSLRATVHDVVPDVVLADISMPPTNTDEGIRLAEELRTTHPDMGW